MSDMIYDPAEVTDILKVMASFIPLNDGDEDFASQPLYEITCEYARRARKMLGARIVWAGGFADAVGKDGKPLLQNDGTPAPRPALGQREDA